MSSITDGFYSLGAKINKWFGEDKEETTEGVVGELTSSIKLNDDLKLDMTDDELITLTTQWTASWETSEVKGTWGDAIKVIEEYWKGKQYGRTDGEQRRPLVDNILFEALETFIPEAVKKNPEPTVTFEFKADEKQLQDIALHIKEKLAYISEELNLALKIQKATRHWAIFLLGAVRIGWDLKNDFYSIKVIRPQKLILDPKSVTGEDGYEGRFIGEYRRMKARDLIDIAPQHTKYLTDECKGKLDTELQFKEFYTDEYFCWVYKTIVILKGKNPYWNYDQTITKKLVDEVGNVTETEEVIKGRNYFRHPKKPYLLLSVFNLGDTPVDVTSLMGQNLSMQDLINKRLKQIDKNADSMNNGMIVSLARAGLTKEQAKGVASALRNGGMVVIPDGEPNAAISKMRGDPLPSDVFNQLQDTRLRAKNIFGVYGITPQGIQADDSVRGKIMTKESDTDRIGGSITKYLERLSTEIFGWLFQMSLVFDPDDPILKQLPVIPPIRIMSRPGSLIPENAVYKANQAVDLASRGFLSPLDLYRALEYPNAEELAANLFLWNNDPTTLMPNDPRIQQFKQEQAQKAEQAQQMAQQQAEQQHQQALEAQQLQQNTQHQQALIKDFAKQAHEKRLLEAKLKVESKKLESKGSEKKPVK